jgi:ectoine hydroxylase-related dioxygenase (phytanoyl-CoA dioxygenase family)
LYRLVFGAKSKYQGVQNPTPPPPVNHITFPQIEVPKDPNDPEFCISFTRDQVEEYTNFFKEYGFVVIQNVIEQPQIETTIDEIWGIITGADPQTAPQMQVIKDYYENKLKVPFVPVNREDPATWTHDHGWPEGEDLGILGSGSSFQRRAFENRTNPIIYDVCKNLMGREDLWMGLDRYGVIKPNTQVLMPNGTRQDFPKYKTIATWMHWDINPFMLINEAKEDLVMREEKSIDAPDLFGNYFFLSERNNTAQPSQKIQGIIALTDARECDGGFFTVPGFSKENTLAWAKHHATERKMKPMSTLTVPRDDPMIAQGRPVPVRAGSVILFDARQPHQNFPNQSDRFRMCQYIKTFPERDVNKEEHQAFIKARREFVMNKLKPHLEDEQNPMVLTELDEKVLGLKPWHN